MSILSLFQQKTSILGLAAAVAALVLFLLGKIDAETFGAIVAGSGFAVAVPEARRALLPFALAAALGACAGGSPNVASAVERACKGAAVAHDWFLGFAPILVGEGLLDAEGMRTEELTNTALQHDCADPPTDTAQLVTTALRQAAGIYAVINARNAVADARPAG